MEHSVGGLSKLSLDGARLVLREGHWKDCNPVAFLVSGCTLAIAAITSTNRVEPSQAGLDYVTYPREQR